jgi:hypothetical protein
LPGATISAGICERLITAATSHCGAPVPAALPPPAPVAVQPNFDGLAASFGALSTAFTWGTIILAVVAILAALGWGYLVKGWAEKEAREEAERCARKHTDAYINKWLATEAPQIVRRHVENILDATFGNGSDEEAADEIGKEAG